MHNYLLKRGIKCYGYLLRTLLYTILVIMKQQSKEKI
ncbi:hypothetical protein SDC9_111443 [bioreactor metagenome]|uniref:Uncharacterized protein n=1 Tax=bioreactor metagenome TaxID=1076179 RepID=A0A645BHA5_9ZZZZ